MDKSASAGEGPQRLRWVENALDLHTVWLRPAAAGPEAPGGPAVRTSVLIATSNAPGKCRSKTHVRVRPTSRIRRKEFATKVFDKSFGTSPNFLILPRFKFSDGRHD